MDMVHSGSLSSVVAAANLVTSSGHSPSHPLNSVVHSAALRLVQLHKIGHWTSRDNVSSLFSWLMYVEL